MEPSGERASCVLKFLLRRSYLVRMNACVLMHAQIKTIGENEDDDSNEEAGCHAHGDAD